MAIYSFEWVKMIQICEIRGKLFSNRGQNLKIKKCCFELKGPRTTIIVIGCQRVNRYSIWLSFILRPSISQSPQMAARVVLLQSMVSSPNPTGRIPEHPVLCCAWHICMEHFVHFILCRLINRLCV